MLWGCRDGSSEYAVRGGGVGGGFDLIMETLSLPVGCDFFDRKVKLG